MVPRTTPRPITNARIFFTCMISIRKLLLGAGGSIGLGLLGLLCLCGVRGVLRERERNGAESNAEAEREYEKLFHLCVISLVEFNKMPSPESYRHRHEPFLKQ